MTYQGIEEERRFVVRSAEELDQYLSSEVLLWRMAGIDLPLCPGNLMLSLDRLNVVADYATKPAIHTINDLIKRRRIAWEKKVNKELPMRVNQWQEQVREIHQYGIIDASYQYNVRTRVIITLLMTEIRYPDNEQEMKLSQTDERLLAMAKPGAFVWDEVLVDTFPQEVYPYLYLQTGR